MHRWKRQAATIAGFGLSLFLSVIGLTSFKLPLYLLIILGILALGMIIYGVIPIIISIFNKVRKLRIHITFDEQNKMVNANSPGFSVKIESVTEKKGCIYLGYSPESRPPQPSILLIKISFRTNQSIQIASLHLEIDPADPRDIIEPDEYLSQGFSLPYILTMSETHNFQFQLSPEKVSGEYHLILKVLAGGHWYKDGPYKIGKD